ncbi:MAG: competence/damage-inducible protein A [Chloroflexota bacterium]
MRAEILSIGTELLLGQILDTNAQYLAGRLAALGIDLLHISTVGDNLTRCRQAVERALTRSDLVVCTGGLGPTEDDLTREAIAAALGEDPAVDDDLARQLGEWFAGRGQPMPERNRKQAWLIPSARAIPNPNGTAPGWDVRRGATRIVAMPGVPREMTYMWERHIEPTLIPDAVRSGGHFW